MYDTVEWKIINSRERIVQFCFNGHQCSIRLKPGQMLEDGVNEIFRERRKIGAEHRRLKK